MASYPIYDITFDPTQDLGLTAISFVDMPAICQDFIYFSKDGKQHKSDLKSGSIILANVEKREIISPILIPNQLILRVDENGQKYYNRWSKEVIEQVATYYMLNQFQNNFTIMHSWFDDANTDAEYSKSFIEGVYLLRMWIIDDASKDEANKKYGYHLPQGTLMVHLKVHNRKLWQRIKSGELKGLSIEAFLPQTLSGKINYNKNNKSMSKKNAVKFDVSPKMAKVFNKFMLWYNQTVDEAEALADIAKDDATESGEVTLKYYTSDTDYIEIKEGGVAVASDGSTPEDGEYPLVDGSVLVIADGKFVETKPVDEASEEDKPEEAPIAEEKEDEEDKEDKDAEGEDNADEDKPADEEVKDEEDDEKEQEEVEAPYTLVPVEIDGVEFQVPQEVADYIHSLEGMSENFRKEIAQMKDRLPSAKPVHTVVKQSKEVVNNEPSFSGLFDALNHKWK